MPTASSPVRHGGYGTAPRRAPPERPAPHPEASRKPLYLCARAKARVDVDGPALHVRSTGRADASYPLYRVSRVISSTCVDWSAAALGACLESGIPIVIVDRSGAPVGVVQPARTFASRLSEDIDELLDRPDWLEIYENWLRAARMRIVGEWRTGREKAGKVFAPGELQEYVRRFVYGPVDAIPLEGATGIWRGAVCSFAASALHRMELQSMYCGAGGTALNLLDDMTRLLELRLRLEIEVRMEYSLVGEAVALKVLHAMTDRLDEQCERLLASLARRVKQVLAEWR